MKKNPLNVDERGKDIVLKVCSTMYVLTLTALISTMSVRQFVLGQPVRHFEDIAIIVTANILVLIVAVLYLGGIVFQKFRLRYVIAGYVIYVIVGFSFTFIKYRILTTPPLSIGETFGKLSIVVTICGLITALFVLFAYLGKRRVEKDLE
jgi:hypothetical protein